MKQARAFLLAVMILLSGCAPRTSPRSSSARIPPSLFDYEASIPFDTKIISETDEGGVTIMDVSYAAFDPSFSQYTGGRTVAYLVKPGGRGSFAGLVYMHWMGTASSSRKEYLEEAVELAKQGAVSLLPQGYFPWSAQPIGTQEDRQLMIGQIIELRRAFDFLLSQPGVDPKRLGFVGHDYGAVYGGVLAGVETRVKTYVLIAGVPSFTNWIGFFGPFPSETYLPLVQDIDPVGYVPRAAPASLFFQFGKRDAVVPESLANQYFDAASQPKKIEWYDDLHDMHSDVVRDAHQAWLIEQLNLSPNP